MRSRKKDLTAEGRARIGRLSFRHYYLRAGAVRAVGGDNRAPPKAVPSVYATRSPPQFEIGQRDVVTCPLTVSIYIKRLDKCISSFSSSIND